MVCCLLLLLFELVDSFENDGTTRTLEGLTHCKMVGLEHTRTSTAVYLLSFAKEVWHQRHGRVLRDACFEDELDLLERAPAVVRVIFIAPVPNGHST